jgi:hypothetical protein
LLKNERSLVAIWDADHSILFKDVRKALKMASDESTFVITERIGAKIEEGPMPRINYLGNITIALFTSMVFGKKVKDALSSTKVFPLGIFKDTINEVKDFLDRDSYGDLSYFLLAKIHGLDFRTLGVDYYSRVYGVSSLNRIGNGLELLQSLKLANRIMTEL